MNPTTKQARVDAKGWCPRVWTPMQSGDGFIVRVRPPLGRIDASDVRALVALAIAYGNGQLDLTRRANLQIRGVTAEALRSLQTELASLGLAEATLEDERTASLLVNPLSDLDPEVAALSSLAHEIDRVFTSDRTTHRLPAKFGVLLDGGGDVMKRIAADIRIDLRKGDEGVAYLSVGDRQDDFLPLGSCLAKNAPAAVRALMQTLSFFQEEGGRRMRDVVAIHGARVVHAAMAPFLLDHRAAPPSPSGARLIGFQTGLRNWLGLGLAFGSGDAATWNSIAEIAERFGQREIKLTPKRSVVIPDVRAEESAVMLGVAQRHGLIVDENDPLLSVTACVGSPACASARGETRTLARELSEVIRPLLAAGATLHISGCNKSCALTGPASVTLVHDHGGCQLGRDLDVAATSASGTMSLASARHRLAVMASDFCTA